jgi:hypothetical protein
MHNLSKPEFSRILKFFDFWLSDFAWYRKLTKGKWEWYRCSSIGDSPLVQTWWKRDDSELFEKLKTIQERFYNEQ